eukprot:gene16561-18240_t
MKYRDCGGGCGDMSLKELDEKHDVHGGAARALFDHCDLDASGYIDRNELAAVLDLGPDEVKEIFATLDKDDDGKISIGDFTENFNAFKELAPQLDHHKDGTETGEEAGDNSSNSPATSSMADYTNGDSSKIESRRPRPKRLTFDRGKGLNIDMKKRAKLLNG